MTTLDLNAPRRSAIALEEDSLEELQSRLASPQSPTVDLDAPDAADGFELPGAQLTNEESTMSVVVSMLTDEFRCSRCFLVCHQSQRVLGCKGRDFCRECA